MTLLLIVLSAVLGLCDITLIKYLVSNFYFSHPGFRKPKCQDGEYDRIPPSLLDQSGGDLFPLVLGRLVCIGGLPVDVTFSLSMV